MENYIKDIFQNLHIPLISLMLPILLFTIKLWGQFRPITFITANVVERSLSPKESRVLYLLLRFLWNTSVFATFLSVMGTFLKIPFSEVSAIISGFILYACYFYFFHKKEQRVTLNEWSFVACLIYLAAWAFLSSYILSYFYSAIPNEEDKLPYYFVVGIIAVAFSAALQWIYKPVFYLLKFSSKKHVYFEDEQKKRWYILYPVNSKEIMIGDHYLADRCIEVKIITREKFVDRLLKIVDVDELEKASAESDISKSTSYFLISITVPIKVELILNSNETILISEVSNLRHAYEVVALYVFHEIKELPFYQLDNLKVIVCKKKNGWMKEKSDWQRLNISKYLPQLKTLYPSLASAKKQSEA